MFTEGIEAALTAYEHRSKLRELGEWLWNRVTKGQVRVVVFGSAGAGKSTLGAVLAGNEVGPDYRDSRHLETYSLQGGVPCSILAPPHRIAGLRRRHVVGGVHCRSLREAARA